jgi:[NiFe] hydrogenase diaphorase moiety large subunit
VIHLRGEYVYLRAGIEECLARRRAAGLLGASVLGHDVFDFEVSVRLGSGAYPLKELYSSR